MFFFPSSPSCPQAETCKTSGWSRLHPAKGNNPSFTLQVGALKPLKLPFFRGAGHFLPCWGAYQKSKDLEGFGEGRMGCEIMSMWNLRRSPTWLSQLKATWLRFLQDFSRPGAYHILFEHMVL